MTVVRLNGTQDKRLGAPHETNTRSQHQDSAAMEWSLSTWLHPEPLPGKPASTNCSAQQLESEVLPAETQKAICFSGKFHSFRCQANGEFDAYSKWGRREERREEKERETRSNLAEPLVDSANPHPNQYP